VIIKNHALKGKNNTIVVSGLAKNQSGKIGSILWAVSLYWRSTECTKSFIEKIVRKKKNATITVSAL